MTDKEFLKSKVMVEISDMNFNQHMNTTHILNTVLICMHCIILILGIVLTKITGYSFSVCSAIFNLIIVLIVVLNNKIGDIAWNKAKRHAEIIMAMNDIIDDESLTSEDKNLHLSGIKNYKIMHSDSILENLVYTWYKNIYNKKREKIEYKDAKGVNYHIGDIVYNPINEDSWLVMKLSEEEMEKYDFNIPYALVLYGYKNKYMLEPDESADFEIEYTPENDLYSYIMSLVFFTKIYKLSKTDIEVEKDK